MKFVLLVEGWTEQTGLPDFLRRWLDNKYNKHELKQRVGVEAVKSDGNADLIQKAAGKTKARLQGHGNEDIIAVIGLLDLYGLPPHFFSGNVNIQKAPVDQLYNWAKKEMENRVNQPKFQKFYQFFAVPETEAWLLSQPDIFPAAVQNFLSHFTQPETISFDKPPAKILNEIYLKELRKGYKKVTDGQKLFAKLDPAIACKACPKLDEMLNKMLALAKAAQP